MEDGISYSVGLDVHRESIVVSVLEGGSRGASEFQVGGDGRGVGKLVRRLRKLAGERRLECAYEAGPCGYALQRRLEAAGIACAVVAPSLIPVKPGERIKTDRRDARKLAEQLRAGTLTAVCAPSEAQEAVRDLCRCREDAREDLMRARHRLSKMLLRRGKVYRAGKNWTQKHRRWLLGLVWEQPAERVVFGDYLQAIEHLEERLQGLTAALEEQAGQDPYREPVGWLRCFRGFDTVNAMTVVAELYDVVRFGSPRKLMAYLGMVPSEHSTGSRRRQGGITKSGNRHVRRALINAAWHYRHRPAVGRTLRCRRHGQPAPIVALADRAQQRLHRRFFHLLLGRGKPKQKAVVAVARELAGFVWAALVLYPQLQSQETMP
jgi:transposase